MTWRCSSPGLPRAAQSSDRSAGFTLIELLVVLAILGFIVALFAGYKPRWSGALGLKGAAAELASGLRLARSEAIASNRPVAFELDLIGHRYRIGSGPPRPLSPELALELTTIAGERVDGGIGAIRFNSDGSSTGGRISLAEGGRRVAVGVDWLTGRLSVADGR